MTKKELKESLAKDDLELVAKHLNYQSSKLEEYIKLIKVKKDTWLYTYFLDLGDEITKELLNMIDNEAN